MSNKNKYINTLIKIAEHRVHYASCNLYSSIRVHGKTVNPCEETSIKCTQCIFNMGRQNTEFKSNAIKILGKSS